MSSSQGRAGSHRYSIEGYFEVLLSVEHLYNNKTVPHNQKS